MSADFKIGAKRFRIFGCSEVQHGTAAKKSLGAGAYISSHYHNIDISKYNLEVGKSTIWKLDLLYHSGSRVRKFNPQNQIPIF